MQEKILLPKAGIILRKVGLIAVCDLIFLVTAGVYEASATKISLVNSGESICIEGKDACIKKISNDSLTDDEVYKFLRIESLAGISTTEGYNTDASVAKSQNSQKKQLSYALKLTDVPIVSIGGKEYREFILNIDEPEKTKANPELAKVVLEKLEIFLGNAPDLADYPTFNGKAEKIFDFKQNSVLLQDINSDRGGYDYFVYISNSFFTESDKDSKKASKKYVYLFSKFSDTEGRDVEWAVRKLDKVALLPGAPAGGGGAGGGILGGLLPFLGLSGLFGGGRSANVGNYQNYTSPRTTPVIPKLAKPPTDVPEPTTVLASVIGIAVLARYRRVKNSDR